MEEKKNVETVAHPRSRLGNTWPHCRELNRDVALLRRTKTPTDYVGPTADALLTGRPTARTAVGEEAERARHVCVCVWRRTGDCVVGGGSGSGNGGDGERERRPCVEYNSGRRRRRCTASVPRAIGSGGCGGGCVCIMHPFSSNRPPRSPDRPATPHHYVRT